MSKLSSNSMAMKSVHILGIFVLILALATLVSSAVVNPQNNQTSSNLIYSKCMKNCSIEQNNNIKICINENKNQTKDCMIQKVSCESSLRIDYLNKSINSSEFSKGRKVCLSTYINCSKEAENKRKTCFNSARNITCEKKCKEDVCNTFVSPVCGIDNKTYSNTCQLTKANMKKMCDGACPCLVCKNYFWFDSQTKDCSSKKFCGLFMYQGLNVFDKKEQCIKALNLSDSCTTNDNCKSGEYCKKPECGSEKGKCVKRPQMCTTLYNPICGCDGKTYSNECSANLNGVNKKTNGVCVQCKEDLDCPTINCFRAPCPVLKCIQGQCLSVMKQCNNSSGGCI